MFDLFDDEARVHFSHNSHPAWSRSGKKLAFVPNGDLWLAERQSARGEPSWQWFGRSSSSWSWDWSRLAATASYDATNDRGSRENGWPMHLSWSPDERYLAYGHPRARGSGEDWTVVLDTRSGKEWTLDAGVIDPAFSPDGKWIAGTETVGTCGITISSRDGKIHRHLLDGEQPTW